MSRLWKILAAILTVIASFLYASKKKVEADAAEDRADFAQRNATAAEKQTEILTNAQEAAGRAAANGEEELQDELEKARRGDRTFFDRR